MHHATDVALLMRECSKAGSFTELLPLAFEELRKFPDGAHIVCGPISTGGRGSVEANLEAFEKAVDALLKEGKPIFSQVPYEERIFFFRTRWQQSSLENAGKYYTPILDEFYLPLFRTKLIRKGWFIPGWESSFGAKWEREQLKGFGAEVENLSESWMERALS